MKYSSCFIFNFSLLAFYLPAQCKGLLGVWWSLKERKHGSLNHHMEESCQSKSNSEVKPLILGGGVFVTAAPHKENKLWVFSPPPTHFMPITKSYQFQFLNTFPISTHSPHLGTSSLVFSFPGGTRDKEPTCQCRRHKRHRFDPWLGRFPGGEHGNPHQFLA